MTTNSDLETAAAEHWALVVARRYSKGQPDETVRASLNALCERFGPDKAVKAVIRQRWLEEARVLDQSPNRRKL
jgi:hypothetical protein